MTILLLHLNHGFGGQTELVLINCHMHILYLRNNL